MRGIGAPPQGSQAQVLQLTMPARKRSQRPHTAGPAVASPLAHAATWACLNTATSRSTFQSEPAVTLLQAEPGEFSDLKIHGSLPPGAAASPRKASPSPPHAPPSSPPQQRPPPPLRPPESDGFLLPPAHMCEVELRPSTAPPAASHLPSRSWLVPIDGADGGGQGGGGQGGGGQGGGGSDDDIRWQRASQNSYGAAFDRGMGTFAREVSMRADAYLSSDANSDGQLDFDEFCALVRQSERFDGGGSSEASLRKRFAELDVDGSGTVDTREYFRFALLASLTSAHKRVLDLIAAWDKDNDRFIDPDEFRSAVVALGFRASAEDIDAVFRALDEDASGTLSFAELQASLRPSTQSRNKHSLRKQTGSRKTSLSTSSRLVPTDTETVQQQLQRIIHANRVRVMDLFRECASSSLASAPPPLPWG